VLTGTHPRLGQAALSNDARFAKGFLSNRNRLIPRTWHTYSRFGRGRGNGTGARTATALCTGRRVGWNAVGATKGAIGSSDGGLRTAGDFWREPVSSSLGGSCFAPLLIFRSANILNTRIATATMLSTVLRLGVSQGTARRFRIGRAYKPEKARFAFGAQREGKSYSAAA
jgi:hypothetical protein